MGESLLVEKTTRGSLVQEIIASIPHLSLLPVLYLVSESPQSLVETHLVLLFQHAESSLDGERCDIYIMCVCGGGGEINF